MKSATQILPANALAVEGPSILCDQIKLGDAAENFELGGVLRTRRKGTKQTPEQPTASSGTVN